jgi:hypothetical protein
MSVLALSCPFPPTPKDQEALLVPEAVPQPSCKLARSNGASFITEGYETDRATNDRTQRLAYCAPSRLILPVSDNGSKIRDAAAVKELKGWICPLCRAASTVPSWEETHASLWIMSTMTGGTIAADSPCFSDFLKIGKGNTNTEFIR